MMRRTNSSFLAFLLCLTGLAAGCGTDAVSEYTVSVNVTELQLTADGSDSARVEFTVLDGRGNPPPVGTAVTVAMRNPAGVPGDVTPPGVINGTDQKSTSVLTDNSGGGQFVVSCDSTDAIRALVSVGEGDQRGIAITPEITCGPAPEGNWTLTLAADAPRANPGAVVGFTLTAKQGDDSNVPTGTRILFEIEDIDAGARFVTNSPFQQTVATPDGSGTVVQRVLAQDTEGSFTVCASFFDGELGSGRPCATVAVGTVPAGRDCVATYAPSRVPADGTTTSVLQFAVYDDVGPAFEATINASIATGDFILDPENPTPRSTVQLRTSVAGVADVIVRAAASTGSASADATAVYADGSTLECDFVNELVFVPPPTCRFEAVEPIALEDTANVRVCFDNFGVPVGAGERVDFELSTSLQGAALLATTAFTDSDGCAPTSVIAGAAPGGVAIRATMPFGANEASCESEPIIIGGGRGSATQMVLGCESFVVGAGIYSRGSDFLSTCPITCSANVLDANNNPVVNQLVYFTSEVGTIGSTAVTNESGVATVTFTSRGSQPRDVAPFADELGFGGPDPETGGRFNPRDSLVTIIAATAGAEEFSDDNGNGRFDDGEFFVDLAEPFVDANEDNQFEPGTGFETFIDVEDDEGNLNGEWDAPNGEWDSSTQIWAQTHVLYSHASTDEPGWQRYGSDGSLNTLGNTLTRGGSVAMFPRDQYGNIMPDTAEVGLDDGASDCVDEAVVSERRSGLYGAFNAYRQLIYYNRGGSPTNPEDGDVAYAEYETRVDFTDPDSVYGPAVIVTPPTLDGGYQCRLAGQWIEDFGTDSCGDTAVDVTFPVVFNVQ